MSRALDEKSLLQITRQHRKNRPKWINLNMPSYVRAWNGLRGLAILGPIYAHIRPYRDTHLGDVLGAVGLMTFMILAGMLSTLILAGRQAQSSATGSNRFSCLYKNYKQRFLRLWPSLFIATTSVAVCYVARAYIKQTSLPIGFHYNVLHSLIFLSDIEPFEPHADSPWKQTWTVAVQEKAYMLWGVLLACLLNSDPGHRPAVVTVLTTVCMAIFVGRFAYEVGLTEMQMFRWGNFLGEVWIIMIGFILPLLDLDSIRFRPKRATSFALVIVSLTSAQAILIEDEDLPKYGIPLRYFRSRIMAIVTAPLVAVCLIYGTIDGCAILETAPLQFLGRCSYAWYLFQVPISSFMGLPRVGWPGVQDAAIALGAAAIVTLYVEEPIRDWSKGSHEGNRSDDDASKRIH